MKFSSFLFFASFALAAPSALQARQDQTVVGVIFGSIETLETATKKNIDEIKKAVDSVKGNVDATVEAQVSAALKANYNAILKAVKDATEAITGVTTGAAGGIAGAVKGLTQQQIDQLVEAINGANRVIVQLDAALTVTISDLRPAIKDAIKSEVDAVKAAITPFVTPIQIFVAAAKKASATIGLTITGLASAETELGKVVSNIIKSLGLPPIILPPLPALPAL